MISGNQTWQNALSAQVKRALYLFEIPDFGIIVTSFTTAALDANITVGGFGVTLLGVGGFGT